MPALVFIFLVALLASIALRPAVQLQVHQALVLIVPLIWLSLLSLSPLHAYLDWPIDRVERNCGTFLSVQSALLLLLVEVLRSRGIN